MTIPNSISLGDAQPGDIIGFQRRDAFGILIGIGQRLRHPGKAWRPYTRIHHIAVVEKYAPVTTPEDKDDPQNWVCIQAARRVDRDTVENIANGQPFVVMKLPPEVWRACVVEQAEDLVGTDYGVLSIVSIALNVLTPSWLHIDFRRARTVICSALGAICLHAGGWLHSWGDFYEVMPCELIEALAYSRPTLAEPASATEAA